MIRKWLAGWMAGVVLLGSVPASGEGIQALVGKSGRVQLNRGRERIAEFGAGVYNLQWVSADASADLRQDDTESKRHLQIRVPGGGQLSGWAELTGRQGELNARYVMTPDRDLVLNSLQVGT